MGTKLNNDEPIDIDDRLRRIGEMVNRGRFKKALTMSQHLNEDILERPRQYRNEHVPYWQQRAMLELLCKKPHDAAKAYANAMRYSDDDPLVHLAFMRDVALYLVRRGMKSVPLELRTVTNGVDAEAVVHETIMPMGMINDNYRALACSIIGRMHLKRGARLHGQARIDKLLEAAGWFGDANSTWDAMDGSKRDKQWVMNNSFHWFITLRMIGTKLSKEELMQRDKLQRQILKDPSMKRRAATYLAILSRDAAGFIARR